MKTIVFIASGIGTTKRGFEAHVEDLYHHIKNNSTNRLLLFKGGGKTTKTERTIFNVRRSSFPAKVLALLSGKSSYDIQTISFFIGLLPQLIRQPIDIIYLGEPKLYYLLQKWRKWTGKKFQIIFFTGGQTIPRIVSKEDSIHHVSPLCINKANAQGIPAANQFLIPHFLNLPEKFSEISLEEKQKLKTKFQIPPDAIVVLSVGAIDSSVKRMDYLIREVSKLNDKIFLILLGEQEMETGKIKSLAQELLPAKNYLIQTVPRHELPQYYSIADIFVLASLAEGFGMVYIEALSQGLPVVAHDFMVSRYVLKEYGFYNDLTKEGNLRNTLSEIIKSPLNADQRFQRHQFVYEHYSWEKVKTDYLKLFT